MTKEAQDAAILKAVRDGTHTLVPMPGDGRRFFIGRYGDCDIKPDAFVLILDLNPEQFEGEEIIGHMMGDLTSVADDGEWNIEEARAGKYAPLKDDDSIPF